LYVEEQQADGQSMPSHPAKSFKEFSSGNSSSSSKEMTGTRFSSVGSNKSLTVNSKESESSIGVDANGNYCMIESSGTGDNEFEESIVKFIEEFTVKSTGGNGHVQSKSICEWEFEEGNGALEFSSFIFWNVCSKNVM
jgi:hypothetical protein